MAATYSAGSVRLEVIPDMSRFGAKLRAEARGLNETVKVGVEVDAASLSRLQGQIRGLRGTTVRVKADVDTGSLDQVGAMAANAAKGVSLIGAAALAAGAALTVLPAALAAAAGAGGVLFLSLKGVGEALQAHTADADNAGKAALANAQRQTAAAKSIRAAETSVADARRQAARTAEQGSRQIESAEARVTAAVEDEKRAQEDVTRARKAAALAAEDLRSRVSHLALDQQQATIRVQEAQDTYNQVNRAAGATDRDRQKALLDLQQAQLDQSDLAREAGRAQAELNDINTKGIDSTDQVQSALARQADAAKSTKDAQAALVQTQRDVAQSNDDASRRISEALTSVKDAQTAAAQSAAAAADSQNTFADAMSKLTAPAQALVTQLLAMKPLLDTLQKTAGAAFLPGLTQMLKDSTALFPTVNSFIGDVGKIMGETARQFGALFQNSEFQKNLQATFQASLPLVKFFGDALLKITDAWFRLGATSGPAVQGLVDGLTLIIDGFTAFMDAMRPASAAFGDIFRVIGSLLGNLLAALGPLVAAIAQALAPMLVALAPVVNQIVTALGKFLTDALVALTPLLIALADAVSAILTPLLSALQPVLDGIIQAFVMASPVLVQVAQVIGEALAMAITALAPLLPPIIDAFLGILKAVLPLVPLLLDLGMTVIKELLLPILPILIDVFVSLLNAILPLLPPILNLVATLLPALIAVIKFLAPIIVWLADLLAKVLTWTIENVLAPALKFLGVVFEGLGTGIKWVWEHVIKPAWSAIVDGLTWVKDSFQASVDWIGRIWNGLRSALAKPINFMIGTVWNNGILPAWNLVADLLPGVEPVRPLATIPEFASGGPVMGGVKGKDSVLAKLMPDEYVLPVKMAKLLGYDNLDRIRAAVLGGRKTSTEGFLQGLPGFAQGGRVEEARRFAMSQAGKPYQWGGVGNPSWDCSGFMSGIQNVLMGRDPRHRLYTTSQFGPGRAAGGLVPGTSSAFTVGVQSGHMAGTLDGVNVESSSSPGVRYGNGARGTTTFPWRFSLPSAGGQFIDGGPGGGGFFDWVGQLLASIADKFTGPAHALINAIPFDAPPQFMGLPKQLLNSMVDKASEWMKGDASNAAGPAGAVVGTGPVQDQVRAVANGFGWGGGAAWDALARIIQKESSWNPNAANSRSSARGLFQKMTSVNGPIESTVAGQAQWGLNYIRSRYGDPTRALAFHNSHGWYDSGGWLPPGATAAFNGTGVPEAVLTSRQWDHISSLAAQGVQGGDGVTINVYTQPGQDNESIAMSVKRRLDFHSRTG